MKLHSFHELAARIAHLSNREKKPVPVIFGGKDAYTDGKSVHLPALESGTFLTPHQYSIWLGYIIHEASGHLTHSDIPLYIKTTTHRNDPVFTQLANIFEDIRIENATIASYPGDRKYLNSTHQYMDDQIPPNLCQNQSQLSLIYKEAYAKYRNFDSGRLQGELSQKFPTLAQAMTKLAYCQSTQDCLDLAQTVRTLIDEEQEEQEERPKGEPSDGQPIQLQTDNNLPAETPENPNGNADKRNPPKPLDNSKPGDSNNAGESRSLVELAEQWNQFTEIKNLIKGIVSDTEHSNQEYTPPPKQEKHAGTEILPPYDLSQDRIFVPGRKNMDAYTTIRTELNSQILSLKKMFRIYLQAQSQRSWLRGLEEGQLDHEQLHLVPTGDKNIFKQRHTRQLTDTAIELMLDLSFSMDIQMVRQAAVVLAEALSPIPQISLSITGFYGKGNYGNYELNKKAYALLGIGRLDPIDILIFKDYTEPYHKCRAKLGGIHKANSTPLGDAYGKALERILPQPEPRRIIFLVTDGEPSVNLGDVTHNEYLLMAKVHTKAQRLGVETLGLAIGPDYTVEYLKDYVDRFVHIESMQTLPQSLMQALKGTIR